MSSTTTRMVNGHRDRPAGWSNGRLDRATFETSRLLDFCSEKELVAQTGHQKADWPLVLVKELVDNALDACEEAGTAPVIKIRVDCTGITISDNGPGIPETTIKSVLDFSIRVSSREAYVSPTRGAQGNALKTILAMPFVLDGNYGQVEIAAHEQRRRITFSVDRIRQQPAVAQEVVRESSVRNGTSVKVYWPDSARSLLTDVESRFLPFTADYTYTDRGKSAVVVE
jgi:DNA topoisomerase VI subunit B